MLLVVTISPLSVSGNNAQTDAPPAAEEDESAYWDIVRRAEEGVRGPVADWHYYFKDGLRIDSPEKNFTLRVTLVVFLDGGYISADEELEAAFPDLEGPELDFRWFRLSGFGTIYDWAQFKIDMDFANIREFKDNYIRFIKIPYIRFITLGHMKEPFSLEEWMSGRSRTFMERSLPTRAFAPGRNIGIRRHTAALEKRMTWGVGAFLNTGSFGDFGEGKDEVSEANGWNITGRVTYLPWYEEEGRRLLHLGLSYTHKVQDQIDPDFRVGLRTRPESRLTDDRLVNTDEFLAKSADLFNPELAMVSGPLSFQGEYFHSFHNADALGDPQFWGFYLYGSYFITGEHRNYGRPSGTFFRTEPKRKFNPRQGRWGAWEVAARFSFIDLNDEAIRGGKEANFTAGLNWYLNKKTRFMFNYINALVKDRETPPAVDSGRAHIFQARFQIEF